MAHFLHDEKNNRIEGLSKEEIYALLAAAIQQGQLPSVDEDTAFVTMFKSIVDGNAYKIGFCTQAQYNAMEAGGTLEANALYIITDDTSYDDIITHINNLIAADASLQAAIESLQNQVANKTEKTTTYTTSLQEDVKTNVTNENGEIEIALELIDNIGEFFYKNRIALENFDSDIKIEANSYYDNTLSYLAAYCKLKIAPSYCRIVYKGYNATEVTYDLLSLLPQIININNQLKPTTTGVTITSGVAYVTTQGTYSINYTSSTGTVNCKAIVSVDGSTLGNYYVAGGLSSSKDADAISIGTSGSNYSITVGSGTITACKLLVAYSE